MRRTKRIVSASLAALLLLGCAGCGSRENTPPAAAEGSAPVSAEGSAPAASFEASTPSASAQASADGSWTAEGNFIDKAENHLLLYHLKVEDGYDEEGWSTTLLLSDGTMIGGTIQEQNGTLAGVIASYQEDGTTDQELDVTLTQEGDQVLLKTGDGTQYRFNKDETDYTAQGGELLPYFQYNLIYSGSDFDPVAAAACDYLAFDKRKDYDPKHVMIPYVEIVDLDESNPEDVLVYGDYYLWEFEKQEDTLVVVSGGHCPGIIHMQRIGEDETAIYSAVSMDEAFTDADVETIFGERLEKYHAIASHPEVLEPKMAQVIADYGKANSLDVTKYQMSGEDPKELPIAK